MYRQSEKLLNSNISSTCPRNMVNTNGRDRLAGLGHPSKFQQGSRLGFVTAASSLNGSPPNFACCFAICWAGILYIHFRGLLPPNGILPDAKFTLRSCLAFCFGSVTARNWSSGRQPNCGMVQGMELWDFRTSSFSTDGATYIPRAAITLGIGPHSS